MSPAPSPAPYPPPPLPSVRLKQKPFTVGIAAGAEDAKYQTKYKELKRKVKDIEADNDKLHFKVLQAKLGIRRMKMERAILYERLSSVPPSPSLQDRLPLPPQSHGPPSHQPSSRAVPTSHQHRDIRDHPSSHDLDQGLPPPPPEHIRSQGNPRLAPGIDGRPMHGLDNSGVASSPHLLVHSPRRVSSGGHESSRHHLPPLGQLPSVHQYERGGHPNSHASPPLHPSESHSRNRSHSSSRSRSHQAPPQPYRTGTAHHHQYSESLPPVQQPLHSPPLSDRERPRRSEHEYASPHDPHAYIDRHQTHSQLSPRAHASEARSSGRIHAHQRLGPGTYITRDDYHDKHRDIEREREWEREQRERDRDRNREYSREMASSHMHSPHRSRSQMDRGDYELQQTHHVSSSSRSRGEEPLASPYYAQDIHAPTAYPRLYRGDTPGSGSGSGSGAGVAEDPSRPDSRAQYYEQRERDRTRSSSSYRLRPVSQTGEDGAAPPLPGGAAAHEDNNGRSSQARADRAPAASGNNNFSMPEQQSHPPLESRKRSRNEMDADSDNDVADDPSAGREGGGGGALYRDGSSARHGQEDRGSKRYHREHRRSVDNHEDSRMGPS